jgi:hypothetical protein
MIGAAASGQLGDIGALDLRRPAVAPFGMAVDGGEMEEGVDLRIGIEPGSGGGGLFDSSIAGEPRQPKSY